MSKMSAQHTSARQAAWERGERAFELGYIQESNPHHYGSEAAYWWNEGFKEARHLSEVRDRIERATKSNWSAA